MKSVKREKDVTYVKSVKSVKGVKSVKNVNFQFIFTFL